jgi:hypothetical protein
VDLSNLTGQPLNTPTPVAAQPVTTSLASSTAPTQQPSLTDSFTRSTKTRHKRRTKVKCRKKKKLSRKQKQLQLALQKLLNQQPVSSSPVSTPVPPPPVATTPPPSTPPDVPPSPPACDPPVAANERATIWGDPHVETADRAKQPGQWYGVCYDIHEAGVFNLLNDTATNVNARFSKGPNNTTIVTETGINLPGAAITYDAAGKLTLNGQPVPAGQTINLPGGGTMTQTAADWAGKPSVKISHPGSEFDITLQQDNWSGFNYLNVSTESKTGGVMADGKAPGGILGETFDADTVAETALKNPLDSYKRDTLIN